MSKLQSIEKKGLVLLLEVRQDTLGKTCYVITCSLGRFRFREMASVIDFLNTNNDLDYVE